MIDSNKIGIFPIILDGDLIKKSLNFEEFIKDTFSHQYNGDYDIWIKQINRILIVDNYNHKISSNFRFIRLKRTWTHEEPEFLV